MDVGDVGLETYACDDDGRSAWSWDLPNPTSGLIVITLMICPGCLRPVLNGNDTAPNQGVRVDIACPCVQVL